jgi:hypothetical protein
MDTPLKNPSPGQVQSMAARIRIGLPAQAFREHLAADDLRGTWDRIDPELRLAWTRRWIHTHRSNLNDVCRHRLTASLASSNGPSHELWPRFHQDLLQHLHGLERPRRHITPQEPPRPSRDVAVLYADPSHPSVWALSSDPRAAPMLMRWNGTTWMVLNYGSASLP